MKWPVKREQRQLFTKMIIAEQRLSNLAATGFYGYKTSKTVHDHYLWTNMYNRKVIDKIQRNLFDPFLIHQKVQN